MLTSATNQEENIDVGDKNSHQEAVKSNNTLRDIATNKKIENVYRGIYPSSSTLPFLSSYSTETGNTHKDQAVANKILLKQAHA